ncbi:peptide/nickel transport system permease protein [Sporobacter termitidis DSM 10068]|uniref:Peptide/nickel transport system permease protein n=1 Tax=Sporobacter termitidis DSM 10068 TaxID=1123282 RepID=A0A1M5XAR3_9FIRM|nr:ABC transporter permease [Sporobacter termitidis]SHH96920.1 peptide/nickel transport system permease protein [Sporobacter termitidis DSM 10068]
MIKKAGRNTNFKVGAILLCLFLILLILSLICTPYDPNKMNTQAKFQPPSFQHLLGTDNFGRDIFSRVMKGAQTVCFVGFTSVAIGLAAGFILGAVSGYLGGPADEVIMRLMDAQMAFPGIILALVLITLIGPGSVSTALALGVTAVPRFCRITRACFMQIKELDYIKAAKSRGASVPRLIACHILPNMLSPLIVTATLAFSTAILAEAGLSYLGLGIQPPQPSWGKMLFEAQAYLLTNPWYAFIPGCMITLTVLGFNLLGDGLRDLTDTKTL